MQHLEFEFCATLSHVLRQAKAKRKANKAVTAQETMLAPARARRHDFLVKARDEEVRFAQFPLCSQHFLTRCFNRSHCPCWTERTL